MRTVLSVLVAIRGVKSGGRDFVLMLQPRADRRACARVQYAYGLVCSRGDPLALGVKIGGRDFVLMLQRRHQKSVRCDGSLRFGPSCQL
jgi:hypothetical protein